MQPVQLGRITIDDLVHWDFIDEQPLTAVVGRLAEVQLDGIASRLRYGKMDCKPVARFGVMPDQMFSQRAVGQTLFFSSSSRRFKPKQLAFEGFEHVFTNAQIHGCERITVDCQRTR